MLVLVKNAQVSFQILHLDTAFRLSHLCAKRSSCITHHAATDYAALAGWALASTIRAGDGAVVARLTTLEELAHAPPVCQNQVYLGNEALRQACLLIEEGDLGLTKRTPFNYVAYIGCQDLVLEHILAASTRRNLPFLLARLPKGSMASALLEELSTVATDIKESQIKYAVGASWAALEAKEGPQGKQIGTLRVETGT